MSRVNILLNTISLHKKLMVRAAQRGVRNLSTSSSFRKSHYETLGVSRDATQAEIKNAYFELSKLYHPDRIAATDENLAKFREVSAAYEVLGNEHSRRLYDKGILGEFVKPGVPEEASDPVVKFYRERQGVARYQETTENMDAWVQTYFREARKAAAKKQQLYAKGKGLDEEKLPGEHLFPYVVLAIFSLFFALNYEDSKVERMGKEFASYFSEFFSCK